jgi:hypothetical protein
VKNDTTIYLPLGFDASTRWAIVANALREAGISDIRPAPIPSRPSQPPVPTAPVIVSSVEI